jgi:hypothetical protein
MTGIFGILESSATQRFQDVAPTQEFIFHRHIYSLRAMSCTVINSVSILRGPDSTPFLLSFCFLQQVPVVFELRYDESIDCRAVCCCAVLY